MFFLTDKIEFPPISTTSPEGIIAFGGDLSVERLTCAYKQGIFPWFEDDSLIIWWTPDPRMVLFPENLKISNSMKQVLKSNRFKVTFNQNFTDVITSCSEIKRKGQNSSWITNEMINSYTKLFDMGLAKSVEVWENNNLVGGLYGVDLGNVFCGESMFSKVSNSSKFAFIKLVQKLQKENYKLIDCQVYTRHLESLGAEEIPREEFLKILKQVNQPHNI